MLIRVINWTVDIAPSVWQSYMSEMQSISEHAQELDAEGFAREVMRRVQALRKDAKLKKTDWIDAVIVADREFIKMLSKLEEQIKEKVGAENLTLTDKKPTEKFKFSSKENVKGEEFEIGF